MANRLRGEGAYLIFFRFLAVRYHDIVLKELFTKGKRYLSDLLSLNGFWFIHQHFLGLNTHSFALQNVSSI